MTTEYNKAQLTFMRREHFVNNTISELEKSNWNPIDGYQYFPLQTLEDATKGLIQLFPDLKEKVSIAQNECYTESTLLSKEESAAIYLYSMASAFFVHLNEALRAQNQNDLEP
ncbi:unnamed protein product, partial [Adineta steineri]